MELFDKTKKSTFQFVGMFPELDKLSFCNSAEGAHND